MNSRVHQIYCCACKQDVQAQLTSGKVIYGHRMDLHHLPFWICPTCRNFVGCHYQTGNPTRPLGVIPTPEIKNARKHLHRVIDGLWQSGKIRRKHLYARLTEKLGRQYHTGEIRSIEEARQIWRWVKEIHDELKDAVPEDPAGGGDRRSVDDQGRPEDPGSPDVGEACAERPAAGDPPATGDQRAESGDVRSGVCRDGVGGGAWPAVDE